MADWFVLGFAIASFPLCIFGLIGNTMVIRIVHKTREMHTTTNYLLANLAVSDAITIFTIPMMYFPYAGDWQIFGKSRRIFLQVCSCWDYRNGFINLNSDSYCCGKVPRYFETFQLEFALKRAQYQESNCSYLDYKHISRFSRFFP